MRFTTEYLEGLSKVENPSPDFDGDDDVCDEYCQIRNYAKDLLRNPEDEESRMRLSDLIKKTEVILK